MTTKPEMTIGHLPTCKSGNDGPEWSGSCWDEDPDNFWECDECGGIIPAHDDDVIDERPTEEAKMKTPKMFAILVDQKIVARFATWAEAWGFGPINGESAEAISLEFDADDPQYWRDHPDALE